jgi:hypothetical protein
LVGSVMLVNGGAAWQGADTPRVQMEAWGFHRWNGLPQPTQGGDMMVLHAVGAHVIQLLPLAGWLFGRSSDEPTARRRTHVVGLVVLAILVVSALSAFGLKHRLAEEPLLAAAIVMMALSALALLVWWGRARPAPHAA